MVQEEKRSIKLVVGGLAQGKRKLVLAGCQKNNPLVLEASLVVDTKKIEENKNQLVIVNHFHLWVRDCLLKGGEPEAEIEAFLEKYQNCVIISDEIGNGIVPMEAFEREYRERTGRILVALASRADEVVRVVCGIGQKIK